MVYLPWVIGRQSEKDTSFTQNNATVPIRDRLCSKINSIISREEKRKMKTAMLIEVFGYIGSFLVVVSMLMSSVVKLRLINTAGSIISLIYAFICGAFPLALMNGCLIIINVFNLFKLLKSEKQYDLVDSKPEDSFVNYILNRYRDDIKTYFPGFDGKSCGDRAYIVCCEGKPAGLLLGTEQEKGVLDVIIDYSTPEYRDCSVGTFLYDKLSAGGIRTLLFAQEESKIHSSYMNKMGYVKKMKECVTRK